MKPPSDPGTGVELQWSRFAKMHLVPGGSHVAVRHALTQQVVFLCAGHAQRMRDVHGVLPTLSHQSGAPVAPLTGPTCGVPPDRSLADACA